MTLTADQTEELKILRHVATGTLDAYLAGNPSKLAHDLARELNESGMFGGDPFKPISGQRSYPNARTTTRGRGRINELEQLAKEGETTHHAHQKPPNLDHKKWHEKWFGPDLRPRLVVGLLVAAAGAIAVRIFGLF